MAGQLLEGKNLAEELKEKISEEVQSLKEQYKLPVLLAAVQVGDNPASAVYVKNQKASCEEVGISYRLHQLSQETNEEELLTYIRKLNADPETTGIILQMPVPQPINARTVQVSIAPTKDVEGMHPENMGRLVYGQPRVAPCTAMAVMELLKSSGISLKGKETVVVGHSEIVGKPLALLLLSSLLESATPTVCHIATRDLAFHTKRAELLIVAVGKAGLIKGEMVKEGAIVVDVGINRVPVLDGQGHPVLDDKGKPKKKTVGDVVFEEALLKASLITPVPGGVGPLTVMMLLKNTLACYKWQREM